MYAHEILAEPLKLQPRWLRIPVAVSYSGISRAKLFVLLSEGKIRSASITTSGKRRGIRIIDRLSLDDYLSALSKGSSERRIG
jgi:hypothetical protein